MNQASSSSTPPGLVGEREQVGRHHLGTVGPQIARERETPVQHQPAHIFGITALYRAQLLQDDELRADVRVVRGGHRMVPVDLPEPLGEPLLQIRLRHG
ncbi:hypothetical protein LUX34_12620 [Streptomyces werraensis]|nr:hypothetical protein [Streptomyces werraensis]